MYNFKALLALDSKARGFLFNTASDFKAAGIACDDKPSFEELLAEFGMVVTTTDKIKRNGHFISLGFQMILDGDQHKASYEVLEDRYYAHPLAVYKKLAFLDELDTM